MPLLAAFALALAIGPQSGVIVRPDVKLPYRIVGHGAPVLMLSGGPGFTVDYMEDIARRVGIDSYGWIMPEQRGTPRAKLAKPTSEALEMSSYVADLEALRTKLGLKQWTVVGQSWGSVLAEGYTVAHPDRVSSLVLLDTPGPDLEWLRYGGDNLARVLTKEDRQAAADAARNNPKDADAQVFESFIANLPAYFYSREAAAKNRALFKPGSVTGSTLPLVFGNLQREKWDVTKSLRRFVGPALVIQGRQDFLGESAAMKAAQALPNSRLVFIERAGHIAWLDQPGPFIGALSTFLKHNAR
jgi:proline iminopeptidase